MMIIIMIILIVMMKMMITPIILMMMMMIVIMIVVMMMVIMHRLDSSLAFIFSAKMFLFEKKAGKQTNKANSSLCFQVGSSRSIKI